MRRTLSTVASLAALVPVVLAVACGRAGDPAPGTFPAEEVDAAAPMAAGPQFPTQSIPLLDFDTACATSRAEAKVFPAYLAIVFDRSQSMTNNGKWAAVSAAMKTFFRDGRTAGVTASLTFFPAKDADMCTADYATPAVPFRALPEAEGDGTGFAAAIDGATPDGKTPTVPALRGAYAYATMAQAGLPPETKVAVVLVTDGNPDGCDGNTIPVAGAEAYGASGKLLRTFVIGIGTSLESLHYIAKRGSTGEAILVADDGAKTADELVGALDRITRTQVSCDYGIPTAEDGGPIDPFHVNVVATTGTGTELVLPYDGDCSEGGWRYDQTGAPTKIILCPATCDALVADRRAKVDVLYGCTTASVEIN